MIEWAGAPVTDGTDQQDRVSPALQAGYFNVDELEFEAMLAIAKEFAEQINFYNQINEKSGNWADLFTADETVIMAMIHSTNLKRAEADFMRLNAGDIERLAQFVMQWARKINFWLRKLSNIEHRSGLALRQKINALVEEKLNVEFQAICAVIDHLERDRSRDERTDFSEFNQNPAWWISKESGETKNEGQGKQRLHTAFYLFYNAIAYLKTIVPIYLQESLESQQHAPATGLFMTFLRLYEKAQRRINRFTQRHLDFYYDQVLIAKAQAQIPERVYLRFTTKPGMGEALIKKATEFTAGKDEKLKEIVFRAENDLLVTDAQIRSLYSLYLQHDSLISPETELGYVTRIKAASPPILMPGEEQEPLSPWPLFGADRGGAGERDAEIGFAVASSLLLLNEGVRKVELSITLVESKALDAESQSSNQTDFIQKFNEIAELLNEDWQVLFYKLFKNAFSIKLTSESGWLDISEYIVTPLSNGKNGGDTGIKIIFTLGQEINPITPYVAELHGGLFTTELALLRCCINPQTNFYPYSLFQHYVIGRLMIDVDVKGVRNLLVSNNYGQLDPTKPFQPFGPVPTCNATLVIGNYEIAKKRVTDLKLNLEWGELPFVKGGFEAYYRNYESDYSNSSFQGRFEALVDGRWRARDKKSAHRVTLFDSKQDSDEVRAERVLQVDLLDDLKPIDRAITEEAFIYSNKSRNGFFRLVLTEPPTAFGHTLYPQLLTKVSLLNARLKKPQETPNQPYTPIINQITLDYCARAEIKQELESRAVSDALTDNLFHIHPFGVETLYPRARDKPVTLFPQYTYQGNLFIGIDAQAVAGSLTLFFYLAEDIVEVSSEKPEIGWFYLAGDGWRQLSANRVHADTTDGFLSSGIVTLDIPTDIERGNKIMPDDLYWLRVSAKKDLHSFCSCYSIQPHALPLKRVITAAYSANVHLPEASKWQPMVTIPGIDQLWLAGKPFGGRIKESKRELITRISERLRHKNRAMTTWDYERLILENFPQVAKVKCFSHMTSTTNAPCPGNVLIVVVPHAQVGVTPSCEKLMLSSKQLSGIKAFAQNIASPYVEINVRNPVYEQVQVRCTVKFASGFNSGFYINRLDRDISDYICPWQSAGYRARFGWSILQKDIESYMRELDYVDFVTNFSMLHITQDDQQDYNLYDTAKDQKNTKVKVKPRYPWSLAVPAKHHFIETMTSAHTIKAEVTGIDELEIGNTFIIGKSGNGK